MKKFTLLAALSAFLTYNLIAQFATGGTQISYAAVNNHRSFISPVADGNYYVTWAAAAAGNVNSVKLAAYDQRGVVLNGWSSGGKNIGPTTGNFYSPQIITSEDSGVIMVWHGSLGDSSFSRIYAQKYTESGQALWNNGNPLQITTGTNYMDENPMIISDRNNGAYIAWTRCDQALDANSGDVYMQHITAKGTVAANWNAGCAIVAATGGLQECWPQLALTPDQSAVYVSYVSGPAQATSLVINKFNTSNGLVADGWTSSGQIVSAGPNVVPQINCNVKLYTDSSNNAIVFWLEQRVTVNGEIYMQQISPAGTPLLASQGLMLAGDIASGQGVNYLQATQDADGNFSITYNNLITNNDVAAMRVQANGTVLWSDTLITNGGASANPYPVYDGTGGLYVFYVNTSTPEKLYGIALDASGKLRDGWTLPGSSFGAVSNYDVLNPNYDINAAFVGGKAIVTWNRLLTSGYYEIFSCNLLSTGKQCTQCIPVITSLQGNVTLCHGHELTLSVIPDPYIQYNWFINNQSSVDSSYSVHVTDSGTYMVIVHNTQQNCSDTSAVVVVTAQPSPVVTLSAFSENNICNNSEPVILSGGSPAGGVFSGPGVSAGDIFTPSQASVGDNIILYTYTNAEGCSTSAAQSITLDDCTGIDSAPGDMRLLVYPNPASLYVVLTCPQNLITGKLEVRDMTGRVVYTSIATDTRMQVPTTAFANGEYMISVTLGGHMGVKWFVVNR